MEWFVPVHPFWEIEAWLFHNIPELRRICVRRALAVPVCVDDWQAQPASLDEVEKPKRELPFGAEHNRDLAETAFPADALYELGTSFYEAVEALQRCTPLREALRRTQFSERATMDS